VTIILELTDTKLRKDSFLQRAINFVEAITGIDLDGDGVGRQKNKIPTIDTNSQEIHIVIRTVEGGHNSGRSYVYRPEHERAQEWLRLLLLYSNKERHKKGALDLKEEHGSGVFYYRALLGRFYESNAFQMWTACLIISGFLGDMLEAQILPEDGTTVAIRFMYFDWALTVMFTVELLMNFCANSAPDKFRQLIRNVSFWFDVVIVGIQIISVFLAGEASQAMGSLKLLRVLRIVRTLRLFTKLKGLNKLCRALGFALVPMCNAFFLLLIATSVYAVFGTHYFGQRSPTHFSNFFTSVFTLFQVFNGDSSIARSLFHDENKVDVDVFLFFVSYVFIAPVILLNVVVAVLLDEFIKFIAEEKEGERRLKEIENEKKRIVGCLDPLTKTLVTFEDTEDLMNKIDEIYLRLDEDDSGVLVFEEFRAGLKNMHVKDPTTDQTTFGIHLTPDDFELISDNGQLLSDDGEFNQQQFRNMMLGELQRYARRTLRNAVVLSNNQEFHSTILLIKLLEQSLFEKMKEGRDEMQQNFAESQNQHGKTDSMLEKVDRMHEKLEHVHEALGKVDRMQEQLEHVHEALAEITSFCRQPQQQKMPADQPAVSKLASKHIPSLQTHECAEGEGDLKSCSRKCNVDGDYLIIYSHCIITPLPPPLYFIFWSPTDSLLS
jgi:voltage-gated sodium channel